MPHGRPIRDNARYYVANKYIIGLGRISLSLSLFLSRVGSIQGWVVHDIESRTRCSLANCAARGAILARYYNVITKSYNHFSLPSIFFPLSPSHPSFPKKSRSLHRRDRQSAWIIPNNGSFIIREQTLHSFLRKPSPVILHF